MASYILFIPDVKNETETRAAMCEVGLGDLLEGAQCQHITGSGPNEGHGHLVHWSCPNHFERDCKLVVDPEIIDWTESKASMWFWMGQEHDRPVAPEDIALGEPVPHEGEDVLLGLHPWTVPIARALPKRPRLDERREVEVVVIDRHAEFYAKAELYVQEVMDHSGDEGDGLQFRDAFAFAIQALSLNYRVNADIVDWLQLFATEDDVFNVCAATVELYHLFEAQKKTSAN